MSDPGSVSAANLPSGWTLKVNGQAQSNKLEAVLSRTSEANYSVVCECGTSKKEIKVVVRDCGVFQGIINIAHTYLALIDPSDPNVVSPQDNSHITIWESINNTGITSLSPPWNTGPSGVILWGPNKNGVPTVKGQRSGDTNPSSLSANDIKNLRANGRVVINPAACPANTNEIEWISNFVSTVGNNASKSTWEAGQGYFVWKKIRTNPSGVDVYDFVPGTARFMFYELAPPLTWGVGNCYTYVGSVLRKSKSQIIHTNAGSNNKVYVKIETDSNGKLITNAYFGNPSIHKVYWYKWKVIHQ